jgi:protein-S-isoprenylcysteine O-methyltransferase Ste14
MMRSIEKLVESLVARSRIEHSVSYTVRQLVINEFFFLIVSPWLLIAPIHWVLHNLFLLPADRSPGIIVAGACVLIGCGLSLTAISYLWKDGRGTPSLKAPTVRLVTSGPYRYCRNPIQLGAFFYILGLGSLFSSLLTGVVAASTGFLVGLLYLLAVEERELAVRYGDEYIEYKKQTPLLFPFRGFWLGDK